MKIENIPENLKSLEFGSHYELIIVRDDQNNIKSVVFGGNYNRYGIVNDAPTQDIVPQLHENKEQAPEEKIMKI